MYNPPQTDLEGEEEKEGREGEAEREGAWEREEVDREERGEGARNAPALPTLTRSSQEEAIVR
eukprot:598115-Hanusia_phi.AAC.3